MGAVEWMGGVGKSREKSFVPSHCCCHLGIGGDTEHWGVQTLGCLVGSGRYLGHKGVTKGEEEPVERSHPWGHLRPAESRP